MRANILGEQQLSSKRAEEQQVSKRGAAKRRVTDDVDVFQRQIITSILAGAVERHGAAELQ